MDERLTVNEGDISFEILFHQNPQPMWIVEVATLRFLLVNDAAIKHYGYTYQEFMSITLADIRPNDLKNMKSLIKRIQHNETIKQEIIHFKKDGSIIYVHITSYTVTFHEKLCRMVLIHDVTEQHIKDARINDAWNRIYQTLESITDGFIAMTANMKITYWNKEAEKTFNITKKQALNKNFRKLCPTGKNDNLCTEFTRAMHAKETSKFETYVPAIDKWLCLTVYPGHKGLTVYFQDITSQKRDEEQIRLKNKNLEDIAYINSHIIRKPIANIMGIVNSLDEDILGHKLFSGPLNMLKASAEELDQVIKMINKQVEDVHTAPVNQVK